MIFWLPESTYNNIKEVPEFKTIESRILSDLNIPKLSKDFVLASNLLSDDSNSNYQDLTQKLIQYPNFKALMSSSDSPLVAKEIIEQGASIEEVLYARYALEDSLLKPTKEERWELDQSSEYVDNVQKFVDLVRESKDLDARLYLKAFQYQAFLYRKDLKNASAEPLESFKDYIHYLKVQVDEYSNKDASEYFTEILKHKLVAELQQYIDSLPSLVLAPTKEVDKMYEETMQILEEYSFKYSDFNYYKTHVYLSFFELYLDNSEVDKAEFLLITLINNLKEAYNNRDMLLKALLHHNLDLTSTFLLTLNYINHITKFFKEPSLASLPLTNKERLVVIDSNYQELQDIHPSIAKNLEVKKAYISSKFAGTQT